MKTCATKKEKDGDMRKVNWEINNMKNVVREKKIVEVTSNRRKRWSGDKRKVK